MRTGRELARESAKRNSVWTGDGIPLEFNRGCGRGGQVAGGGMGMRGGAVCHMRSISDGVNRVIVLFDG